MIEKLTTGNRSMFISISGRQICNLVTLGAIIISRWCRWRAGWRWDEFMCRLFASDLRRCTWSFAAPMYQWILCCAVLVRKAAVSSGSNHSGLPGFGPGWNRNRDPSPGSEAPREPNRVTSAVLLPGPHRNPRFFGRVGTGPLFHFKVPKMLAAIKISSFHRIMTWSIRKRCSFGSSFTSCSLICTPINIRWVAMK